MSDKELTVEPVLYAQVSGLTLTCGMCEGSILIENEALDLESGTILIEHQFDVCPECDHPYDASGVAFYAATKQEATA